MSDKPTDAGRLAKLDALLNEPDGREIEVLPDGTVRDKSTDAGPRTGAAQEPQRCHVCGISEDCSWLRRESGCKRGGPHVFGKSLQQQLTEATARAEEAEQRAKEAERQRDDWRQRYDEMSELSGKWNDAYVHRHGLQIAAEQRLTLLSQGVQAVEQELRGHWLHGLAARLSALLAPEGTPKEKD